MRHNKYIIFAVLLYCLAACELEKDDALLATDTPETEQGGLVSNELNVLLTVEATDRIGKDSAYLEELRKDIGASGLRPVIPYNEKFAVPIKKYRLNRWYRATYKDAGLPTRASGITHPAIEKMEVVKLIRVTKRSSAAVVSPAAATKSLSNDEYPFNDPLLPQQWHYHNDGSREHSIAGSDINLFDAWKIETGKPNVIVAIIDEGVDVNHPDLAQNMWINEAEKNGLPGVDDDGNGYIDDINGYNLYDDNGTIDAGEHGTHVAGTVGAVNNNGIGVCGIAGGSGKGDGVRMMSVQILKNDYGSGTNEYFYYAAINGAVIAQCSFGGNYFSDYENDMLQFFCEVAGTDGSGNQTGPMKGGIVIVAAGNDAADHDSSPDGSPLAFSVGAIGGGYRLSSYSNYGKKVDIIAPGGDFINEVLSSAPDNSYMTMNGTSMACPHVSGIAALVVSKFGGPGFTPEMLKKRLLASAHNIDQWNPEYIGKMGAGLIDAARALNLEPIIKRSVSTGTIEVTPGKSFTIDYTVSDPENHAFTKELITDCPFVQEQSTPATTRVTLSPRATDSGSYRLTLKAVDEFGGEATDVLNIIVKGTPPQAPTLLASIPHLSVAKVGENRTVALSGYFSKEPLTYAASSSNNSVVSMALDGDMLYVTARGTGQATVTVRATNSYQLYINTHFTVSVAASPSAFTVYPMPVKTKATVSLPAYAGASVALRLYDVAGRQVIARNITLNNKGEYMLDMTTLAAGSYALTVEINQTKFSKTIVKK